MAPMIPQVPVRWQCVPVGGVTSARDFRPLAGSTGTRGRCTNGPTGSVLRRNDFLVAMVTIERCHPKFCMF